MHNFETIGEFKLELKSGDAQFVSQWEILVPVTLKFEGRPWKTIGHLFYANSSFVYYFSHQWIQTRVTVRKCSILGKVNDFFVPCNLEICYPNLFAWFHSHRLIQTGVTDLKRPLWVKIDNFVPCDLEIWWMTLKNDRAPLLFHIKTYASFHCHMRILTGVTVRKRLS